MNDHQLTDQQRQEFEKMVEDRVTKGVTRGVTVLVTVIVTFVVSVIVFKYVWAWVIPDLFPGAVVQGLINGNLSWLATVKLAMEGQEDIAADKVVVDSSTSISCTFDIADAEGGDWDVVVRNPDGQEGLLEDAVFVNSLCGNGSGTALLMLGLTLGLLSLAGSTRLRKRRN